MSEYRAIRIRCIFDMNGECTPHEHYAIDIRLPLTSEALSDVLMLKCSCGEKLIILGDGPDPWDRTNGPATREHGGSVEEVK